MESFRSFSNEDQTEDEKRSRLLAHPGWRVDDSPLDDSVFQQLSKVMESMRMPEQWVRRPRTYFILCQINKLDLMRMFIAQGLDDTCLPYANRSLLPEGEHQLLNFLEAQEFLGWQQVCKSKVLHLEQGEQLSLPDGDVLFEPSKPKLGNGSAMNTIVDKVTSRMTGRVYARKRIMRKKYPKDAQRAFQRELSTLTKVGDHKHLIKVQGTYTDKKYFVLLLEPVADGTLKSYLLHCGLLDTARKEVLSTFFGCMANVMVVLHDEMKILHKDIKADNFLLKDMRLILTDFGTAFDWSQTDQSMTLANRNDARTLRYASPEVISNGEFHRASDIWSLGVVYLEMVTVLREKSLGQFDSYLASRGKRTNHIHANLHATLGWTQELRDQPGPLADNGPLGWVMKMLDENPSNRPTASLLFEAVTAFQNGRFCGSCCFEQESDAESDSDLLLSEDDEDTMRPGMPAQVTMHDALEHNESKTSLVKATLSDAKLDSATSAFAGIPRLSTAGEIDNTAGKGSKSPPETAQHANSHFRSPESIPVFQTVRTYAYPRKTTPKEPKPGPPVPVSDQKKTPSLLNSNEVLGSKPTEAHKRDKSKRSCFLPLIPKFSQVKSAKSKSGEKSVNTANSAPTMREQLVSHYLSSLPISGQQFDDMPGLPSDSPKDNDELGPDEVGSSSSIRLPDKRHSLTFTCLDRGFGSDHNAESSDEIHSRLIHFASDGDLRHGYDLSLEEARRSALELKAFRPIMPKSARLCDSDDKGYQSKNVSQLARPDTPNSLTPVAPDPVSSTASSRSKLDSTVQCNATECSKSELPNKSSQSTAEQHVSNLSASDVVMEEPTGQTKPSHGAKSCDTPDKEINRVSKVDEKRTGKSKKPNLPEKVPVKAPTASDKIEVAKSPNVKLLGSFVDRVPERPRIRDSASTIMKRILDDKASVAPTSVVSRRTKALLSRGLPAMRWNDERYGYLPHYVANGKVTAVRKLLEGGCNPGTIEKTRRTPMLNAIRGRTDKHNKCLLALVQAGANVNATDPQNGYSYLHYAISQKPWSGYSTAVYILLTAKADPNIRDRKGNVPFLMLLRGDGPLSQEERSALLLLLAPNFETEIDIGNPKIDENLLHLVTYRKDPYALDAILEKLSDRGTKQVMLQQKNRKGFTPLLLVLHSCNFADDESAETTLHLLELLLGNGACPNDMVTTTDDTALHLVIREHKNTAALNLLIKYDADPRLRNKQGSTPRSLLAHRAKDSSSDPWYAATLKRVEGIKAWQMPNSSGISKAGNAEEDSMSPKSTK